MRRFWREHAMNSESAETANDGRSVRESSEAEQTGEPSLPMGKLSIISFARLSTGRILKFAVVGGTGVIINTSVLYMLSRWADLPLVAASALAVEFAAMPATRVSLQCADLRTFSRKWQEA